MATIHKDMLGNMEMDENTMMNLDAQLFASACLTLKVRYPLSECSSVLLDPKRVIIHEQKGDKIKLEYDMDDYFLKGDDEIYVKVDEDYYALVGDLFKHFDKKIVIIKKSSCISRQCCF
ncbi:MAG: hypothetical protein Edafosvirus12_14 [Edafosvirus sp.]|uniref:Uncharacterized protein n=1 Tax=Edafosvirus sp. TaxID=2487765 RepID=A0A3G4ZU47_9VIRU|nr:MAG: hypothetical protein Edafosvirus12_14 [Edafosvirus sp.]